MGRALNPCGRPDDTLIVVQARRHLILPPLARAALGSLLAVLVLGVALDRVLAAGLEREVLERDRDLAAFLADRIAAGARPGPTVARFLAHDHRAVDHLAVRVWDARARRVAGAAPRPAPRAAFAAAMGGRPTSERVPGRAELRHVVPLRDPGTGRPAGAVEVIQRSQTLDHDLARLHGALALLLAGGFALLWLALVPTVLLASRRLARQAAAADHHARHDAVTGLLNRAGLVALLEATPVPAGVGVLDLDGFGAINAVHGAARGDATLVRAARVLEGAAEPGTVVARVGPDEFAVLVPGAGPQRTGETLARLAAALAEPTADGQRGLRAHGGFAAAPADDDHPADLLAHACAALARARAEGGPALRRVRAADAVAARRLDEQRAQIERLLAAPDALSVVTQPVVAVSDGRVRGYEALTRIDTHPRRGPDAWFEQARRVGLGPQLEALALRKALALAPARPPGTILAVNLSPGAVVSPEVQAVLPPDLHGIIVEITEHELASAVDGLPEALADLRVRGAGLAVDDAGAGYAGLTQTVALAPDAIKLDRALISGIDTDRSKAALVEAFVSYARRTGAKLCAEGVETLDELRTLAWLDVDRAQGYGLARPGAGFPAVAGDAVAVCRAVTADALRPAHAAPPPLSDGVHHLADLGARLDAAEDLRDVGEIAAGLAGALHVDEVVLAVVDADLETATAVSPAACAGFGGVRALAGTPRTRSALRREACLQVLRSDEDGAGERALLAGTPHGALLVVPVLWRARPVGALQLLLREERAFTRWEIARARVVAQHLGAVLAAVAEDAEPAGTAALASLA